MTSLPAPDRLLADTAWLRSLTRRLVGNEHAADLQQDVALASLKHEQSASRSWLATVARNLAVSLFRQQAAERRRVGRLSAPEPVPSAADLAETAELQQRAVAAVLALPAAYRDTVLMRFLQGLSVQATATAMDVPEETVRTRQKRALAMLREQLVPVRRRDDSRRRGVAVLGTMAAWSYAVKAKHVVTAVVVVLAAFLAGTAWWMGSTPVDPEPTNVAAAAASGVIDSDVPEVATPPITGEGEVNRTAAPVVAAPVTTAMLRVRVAWQDTHQPVVGAAVLCRLTALPGRFGSTDTGGEVEFGPLEPGRYQVQLHNWSITAVTLAAREDQLLELEMPRGQAAQGTVVDADDRPVADAAILVSAGGTQPQWSFPVTKSDRSGRFSLAGLRNFALIGARHSSHGTSDFRFIQGEPSDGPSHRVNLRLPGSMAGLRGVVVDGAGDPIANAWVMIGRYAGLMHRDNDGQLVQTPPARRLATDAEGRFSASELRSGNRDLTVYRQGFGPHRQNVVLTKGATGEVRVVLRPGATLFGEVRTEAGESVANATVEVDRWEFPEAGSAETDSNGSFRFENVELGKRKFRVQAPGFAAQARTFELTGGDRLEWNVVVSDRGRLHGRLVDANGGPLADHWVAAKSKTRGAKSDAEGRFVLALKDGENTLLVRTAPGFAPVAAQFEGVSPGGEEQEFVIGPEHAATAHVRGLVVDAGGAPLVGAQIEIRQAGWPVDLNDGSQKSRADGSFALGPLPPGTYGIQPFGPHDVFLEVVIEVDANGTVEMGTLRGARPARLVVNLTGDRKLLREAVAELVVDGRAVRARRNRDLRRFDRAFPGSYQLVVRVGDREFHRVAIELDPGADETREFDVR